jgi:hypothetical protein
VSKGRQLYELQEVDLEIDAKRETLSNVQSQLGQSQALDEAHATLAKDKNCFDELKASQRAGEWEVDDLRTKVAVVEEKLYGGSVKNPKELASLQEQAEYLKKRKTEEEDKLLDIMTETEAAQTNLAMISNEVESLEKSWEEEQAKLSKEQNKLSTDLANLEQKRKELSSRIDAASLRLYEELRAKKQGRAVAKVEQGMCQGCRIVLPVREMQRARGSQELVQCGSCERILYVS